MNTYKIKIIFNNGNYRYIQANRSKLIKSGNVEKYVRSKGIADFQRIEVFSKNSSGGTFKEITFDQTFESWRRLNKRIEAINAPGWEDLTGYGSITDGRKNRFYIGKSTGFVPIYLEILKSNSYGGAALSTKNRTFRTL